MDHGSMVVPPTTATAPGAAMASTVPSASGGFKPFSWTRTFAGGGASASAPIVGNDVEKKHSTYDKYQRQQEFWSVFVS